MNAPRMDSCDGDGFVHTHNLEMHEKLLEWCDMRCWAMPEMRRIQLGRSSRNER